jgi:AAA family ATP:ADP antiporter
LPFRRGSHGVIGRIAEIKPAERLPLALLFLTNFFFMNSYYLVKVLREPLILLGGGAELKTYSAGFQAVLLLVVVQLFGKLAKRYSPFDLVRAVCFTFGLFFMAMVLAARAELPIGVVFYVWVGMYGLLLAGQFWSFANDLFTVDEGKRMFAMIALGSSLGAWSGSSVAGSFFRQWQIEGTLIASILFLVSGLVAMSVALKLHRRPTAETRATAESSPKPLIGPDALKLISSSRYLTYLTLLVVLSNIINTTGEYVLDRTLLAQFTTLGLDDGELMNQIGEWKANFFTWVNVLAVVIQTLAVGWFIRKAGALKALWAMPVIALIGYGVLLFVPILAVIQIAKTLENSVDYSLNNTARHAAFLTVDRDSKYKAQTAIETVFPRLGDVLSAILIWIGTSLSMSTSQFIWLNIGLVTAALWSVRALGRVKHTVPGSTDEDSRGLVKEGIVHA